MTAFKANGMEVISLLHMALYLPVSCQALVITFLVLGLGLILHHLLIEDGLNILYWIDIVNKEIRILMNLFTLYFESFVSMLKML